MMNGTTEEMIKKRLREKVLFETQAKIYSNKKFDPSRFFREEQQWETAITEVTFIFTYSR